MPTPQGERGFGLSSNCLLSSLKICSTLQKCNEGFSANTLDFPFLTDIQRGGGCFGGRGVGSDQELRSELRGFGDSDLGLEDQKGRGA